VYFRIFAEKLGDLCPTTRRKEHIRKSETHRDYSITKRML
jgi:hypothetical protein